MSTTTFTHSDDGSTYTIPSGINVVKFEVYGAGGGASGGDGGDGGYASGILTGLSGGDTFTVYAGGGGNDFDFSSGQEGVGGTGAWYNGGDGGSQGGTEATGGSGGGAASGVIRDSDGAVMVAGGGGGGGSGRGDEDENDGAGPGGGGARGGDGGVALETGFDAGDGGGGSEGSEGGDGADGDFGTSSGGDGNGVVYTSLEKTSTVVGGGNSGSTDGGSDGFGEDGEVVITEVVPNSPSISVSSHSNNSVTLDIGDTDYEDSATLSYKETNDATWTDFATYSTNEIPLTETVTGLNEGVDYDFRITVSNSAGSSSNLTSQQTNLPAPNNFVISNTTDTSTTLAWNLQSVDENGVRVFRSENGDPYQEIANLSSGAETYQNTGLLNGTEYTYYSQVYTDYTTSDSITDSTTTEINDPENLQDVSDTRNRIDVTWQSNLNEGNFYIEYERLSDNSIQKSKTVNYTTKSSFIDNVDDGVEYEVRVRSETSQTTGPFTSITTRVFIPHSRFTQKAIDGQGKIELQWEKIDTFDGGTYEVYRSETQGNLGSKIATLSDTITRYVDDNTEFNTEYYYTLRRVIE